MGKIFNFIICDDDTKFLQELITRVKEAMEKGGYEYNITPINSGIGLIEYCQGNMVDIALVDIDMPKLTGFEAVQQLQKHQPDLPVIFVTAHREYAYQAYDYRPYYFIDKSDLEKLNDVLYELIKKLIRIQKSKEIAHIFVNDSIIDINVNEIMYFKSKRNYIMAHYSDGSVKEIRAGIKAVCEQLEECGFVQAHRSYVLNSRFIFDFSSKEIIMRNEEKLPVTRDTETRRKAQKLYGRFKRELRW